MEQWVDTRALRDLRRDLKQVAPEVKRELDRNLKTIGRDAAKDAARRAPKLTGKLAGGYKVSLTAKRGVAVVNRQPHARQHEYGAKIHLRRGLPYPAKAGTPLPPNGRGKGGRVVPVDRVPLGDGRVVNVGEYLIRRSRPARAAVDSTMRRALGRIDRACRDAAERALS